MATREIKTTLVLDGEQKFKQSLQSVDREMRVLSSELGAVTSAYGKNETSMAKCKAVGENLAKQVEQQQTKLTALKGAVSDSQSAYDKAVQSYNEAANAFGKNSTEAQLAAKAMEKAEKSLDGYRVQCNNAEKKLNELNTAQKKNDETAKKLSVNFEKMAKKAAAVGTACGKAATEAAKLGSAAITKSISAGSKALTAYATTALAAGTAVAKLAANSALAADDINTLATQTGLSTEAIQKFQYASDLIDVDIDTLTGSMAKLVKNMNTAKKGTGDASDAFTALGISIKDDITGELRNNEDVFNEAIIALGKIENETQRDAYAMSIFGKSAQDLNPLILGGADALAELGNSADKAGLILSQDALDHLNEFNDSIDILKANASAAGKVVSVSLSSSFKEITDEIGAAIPQIAHQFAALFSSDNTEAAQKEFEQSITKLADNAGAIINDKLPTFLNAFNTVISAIVKQIPSGIKSLLPVMIDGLLDLVNRFVEAIPELAPTVVDAGLALFGGLIDGINATLDKLLPMLPSLIDKISTKLIDGIPTIIEGGFKLFMGLVEGLEKALPKIIDKVGEMIPDMVSIITKSLPKLVTAVTSVVTGVVKALAKQLPTIAKEVAKLIPVIIKSLLDAVPDLLDAAIELFMALVEALPIVAKELLAALPEIITKLASALIGCVPKLAAAAGQLLSEIPKALVEAGVEAVKQIPQMIANIAGSVIAGVGEMASAAFDLFFPLSDEAKKAEEQIKANADAVTPFTDALQNAEPTVSEFSGCLSEYGNTLGDIDTAIDGTEQKITTVLKQALQDQQGLRDEDIKDLEQYISDLRKLEQEKLSIYQDSARTNMIMLELDLQDGGVTQEDAATYIANAKEIQSQADEAAKAAYAAQISNINNIYKASGKLGSNEYAEELKKAQEEFNKNIAENAEIYKQAIQEAQDISATWVSSDAANWAKIALEYEQYSNQTTDGWKNAANNFNDWTFALNGAKDEYRKSLAEMNLDNANAFLAMVMSTKKNGAELADDTKEIVKYMLAAFDNLPNGFDQIGKESLLGMIKGLEQDIPELTDTANMTANDIVDTIKTALDIHSPSRVMAEIGSYTIQGLIEGLVEKTSELEAQATAIGASLADGIESGFNERIESVNKNVMSAVSSMFNSVANAPLSGGSVTVSGTGKTSTVNKNLSIVNNGPKALTPYEQMEQSRRAAQFMSTWG